MKDKPQNATELTPEGRGRNRQMLFICLTLAVVTLAVFWQVKDHGFIALDDNAYVTGNTRVLQGISIENLKWALTTGHVSNWHPLTWLSHMADVQFFGVNAGWHHLMNVFLHIANALLLFLIFHRMTKAPWKSAFVAALFALHPLHVESVAWVAERKDVLSTLFWMLTMGAYAYYVERPGVGRYLFVVGFFVLGLLSKPMLVTLPFVLLLLDFWTLGRFQPVKSHPADLPVNLSPQKKLLRRKGKEVKVHRPKTAIRQEERALVPTNRPWLRMLLFEKAPLLVFSLLSCILTIHHQQDALRSLQVLPVNERIANAIVSYGAYLGKAIWPQNLAVFYPLQSIQPLWQILAAALVILAATFFFILKINRFPYLAVGWFWYLGTLVPVIGLVQVGLQAMADRYSYVPLIGIFVMLAWGLPDCLQQFKHRKTALGTLSGITILACIIVTWMQVQRWKDSETLFRHTLKATQENYIINNNLGTVLSVQEKIDDAITYFRTALRINPNYADAWYNLGNTYGKSGQTALAIEAYQQALRVNPKYIEVWHNLGIAYGESGQTAAAIEAFREALRINPEHGEASFNLGNFYRKSGQTTLAIEAYQQALHINPEYVEAWNNLGIAYVKSGQTGKAGDAFRKALRINPEYAKAWFGLGIIYLESGQNEQAKEVLERLKAIDPGIAKEFSRILPQQ